MIESQFILFTLVLARLAGLTATAPAYGASEIPLRIRALLALTLGLLILPTQWHTAVEYPENVMLYLVMVGCEAAIGACLGLGVLIVMHGMTLAGEMVGHACGLTMAEVLDPSLDESVPLFSRLLFLVSLTVFLCLGGHRMVMAGLLETFQTIPAGKGTLPDSLADGLVTLTSQSFVLGVRAAAPVVTALLLATLLLGLLGRTLPQLNVLSVGFGLSAMLAFAGLALTFGTAVWAFADQIQPSLQTVLNALTPHP
jgi:flagellar biosynthesis protein FliR